MEQFSDNLQTFQLTLQSGLFLSIIKETSDSDKVTISTDTTWKHQAYRQSQ